MRVRSLVFVVLISFAYAVAQNRLVAENSAVSNYEAKTGEMARQAIMSELLKQPERWNTISIKVKYQLDRQGRVHSVKIVSAIPNRWVEQTARRALSTKKFPPVPAEVLAVSGLDGVNVAMELNVRK